MVRYLILTFIFFCNLAHSDEELEITAEQFTYDKDNTRIYATGGVKIVDEKFKLTADKVFLNNTSNVLSARDNITIFNSDGSILKADKIVADQELRNAIIEKNFLYLPSRPFNNKENYLRLAAQRVERRGESWEKLQNGVFTACEICFNEKTGRYDDPLIQLRAKKIIHDKKSLDVKYYDTFVDFKGKSVFYLPYFSHASPLVKRKAGFISPSFIQNHYFGFATDIPYYIPIDDHQDITVKPKFSQKKNPVLFVEHRKNFFNGEIFSEFSGTIENNKKKNGIKEDKKRGHIKSTGSFDLNKSSYIDFQVHRTTDRHYLNTYKYGYQDTLTSFVKLNAHRHSNFYSLESYMFQDLRQDVNRRIIPKIFPRLSLNLNSEKKINLLNFETNLEMTNLKRDEGNETKMFFVNQNIFFPTIFSDGTMINFGAHLNGGIFHIKKYHNPKTGKFKYSEFKSNLYPQISIELSKPYVKYSKKYKTIVKPKFMYFKTSPKAFNREIPDESNVNNFYLDYFDLFNRNRLSGLYRGDSLDRFDYGLSFLKQSNYTKKFSKIGLAQSYNFDNHKFLPTNSGINDKFSDILGNLEISPFDSLNLSVYLSLDKDDFSIKNAYSTLMFNVEKTFFNFRNINAPAVLDKDGKNLIDAKNQFNLSIEQKFSEYWSFTTSSTFDKKNKIKFHDINAKIKYEDECLGFSFNWSRQYTHMPENPTSNSFQFLFSLKEIMENDI